MVVGSTFAQPASAAACAPVACAIWEMGACAETDLRPFLEPRG